jgi:hypothetical protein
MSWFTIATLIIELVGKYGLPLATKIIDDWHDEIGDQEPTLEDIQALKDRVPPPETFFQRLI